MNDRPIKLTTYEREQIGYAILTYANDFHQHVKGNKFKPDILNVVQWIEDGILSGKTLDELQGS